uniref:Putative secreted protein n=1 Tax=Ixodes ricinus TaxID=34613 RepID=A0A6B0URL5_IXORI
MLHFCIVSIVLWMSLGSQVVRLPITTSTSRLVWVGKCRSTSAASSREFCKEGSPDGTLLVADRRASTTFEGLPTRSKSFCARLLLVEMTPTLLMGFWSKNSSTNSSSIFSVQTSLEGFKSGSDIASEKSTMM